MRITTPLKLGLVSTFSCFVILLSMFLTTGTASAHTTQALKSQASASTLMHDPDRDDCRTFIIVLQRFKKHMDNIFERNGHLFHHRFFKRFEKVLIVTICHGHRFERITIISV